MGRGDEGIPCAQSRGSAAYEAFDKGETNRDLNRRLALAVVVCSAGAVAQIGVLSAQQTPSVTRNILLK